VIAGPGGGVAA